MLLVSEGGPTCPQTGGSCNGRSRSRAERDVLARHVGARAVCMVRPLTDTPPGGAARSRTPMFQQCVGGELLTTALVWSQRKRGDSAWGDWRASGRRKPDRYGDRPGQAECGLSLDRELPLARTRDIRASDHSVVHVQVLDVPSRECRTVFEGNPREVPASGDHSVGDDLRGPTKSCPPSAKQSPSADNAAALRAGSPRAADAGTALPRSHGS